MIEGGLYDNVNATIVSADILYKFKKMKSFRTELQHLFTKDDLKNWVSALVEMGYAPHWTVFLNDLYNYGDKSNIHYYNGGFSYTYDAHRVLISYGRQRAGLVCTGGVCRLVPASTGLNIMFTSSF